MTINQALDKLTNGQKLTPEQEKLKVSLLDAKMLVGGRTQIEDKERVSEILEQSPEPEKEWHSPDKGLFCNF